jgi:hypothetical protein
MKTLAAIGNVARKPVTWLVTVVAAAELAIFWFMGEEIWSAVVTGMRTAIEFVF